MSQFTKRKKVRHIKTLPPTSKWHCSICKAEVTGYGNNAWPINAGRCCDTCNAVEVLPERLKLAGVRVTNG